MAHQVALVRVRYQIKRAMLRADFAGHAGTGNAQNIPAFPRPRHERGERPHRAEAAPSAMIKGKGQCDADQRSHEDQSVYRLTDGKQASIRAPDAEAEHGEHYGDYRNAKGIRLQECGRIFFSAVLPHQRIEKTSPRAYVPAPKSAAKQREGNGADHADQRGQGDSEIGETAGQKDEKDNERILFPSF